jgi:hypothetical protein
MLAVDTAAAASLAAIVASTAVAAVVASTAAVVAVSTAVAVADRTVVAGTDKKRPIYSANPAASAAGLFYCHKRGLFRHWLSRGLNVWYLAIE